MCLILLAWQAHPDYPLVVAANRDEFYARATAPAAFWPEAPDLLAGRDLEAGGTWLGITRSARFAALTNYRDGNVQQRPDAPSRGALVADFLRGCSMPENHLRQVQEKAQEYNGFNLLVGDTQRIGYLSNSASHETTAGYDARFPHAAIRWLSPGIYGLSNHLLNTPWPKLLAAKAAFAKALADLPDTSALFDLLADDEIVPDACLPQTGVPLAWERLLSAVFVKSPDYGTRASTVLMRRRDGQIHFVERAFGRGATCLGEVRKSFHSAAYSATDVPAGKG